MTDLSQPQAAEAGDDLAPHGESASSKQSAHHGCDDSCSWHNLAIEDSPQLEWSNQGKRPAGHLQG
jgi:hypothetical protein